MRYTWIMKEKLAYKDIALCPEILAEIVCQTEYKGKELGQQILDHSVVAKVEHLRKNMDSKQVTEFCLLADKRCRDAYSRNAPWFMKCVESSDGRNQLVNWLSHWLCSYLLNRAVFLQSLGLLRG